MFCRATAFIRLTFVAAALVPLAACGEGGAERGDAEQAATPTELPGPELEIDTAGLALPEGITARHLAKGRELFTSCVVCHGEDGAGTQLAPSLRDDEWIHGGGGFEEILRIVRQGVADPVEFPVPMPVRGGAGFSEEELLSVAAYTYGLSRGAADRE